METVLCLAHTDARGELPKAAGEVLNASLQIAQKVPGSQLVLGIVGGNAEGVAGSISAAQAARFLAVSGEDVASARYSSDAQAVEAMVRESKATLVLAPATLRFSRALPGVVKRLSGRIDTHVSGLDVSDGQLRIQRWFYRQRMVAHLTRTDRPWCLLVDAGAFSPWEGEKKKMALEEVHVSFPDELKKTSVLGVETPVSDTQTIRPDADVLFVAGAGWTKKQSDGRTHAEEASNIILKFLELSQASLGSSKSLVDQSGEGQEVLKFLSHLNQVGQTGSTPRHPKGLASCCHGEEPHVVGWRFVKERRAINLDPNCGWAQGKADLLYVADAFKVMDKVNELLSKS